MDKTLYDQITNLIDKSQKILVLAHAKVDCDGIGAALVTYMILKDMGKDVTVATNDPAPENLHFLPSIDILKNSLAGTSDFIITVDSSRSSIGKIKYNVEGNKINIIITPKDGSLTESDVSFQRGANKFDLIIVLDTGNLEHLGAIYDKNVEMFYETPVINIDHHASNTDFGQANLVDPTASSTTEIIYEYLVYLEKRQNKKLITENIATLLLAGIITDTGSFQHANTSPRAMETSSKLLDLGARQQEIIKNIYKTKKLSTLKLWGIVLSKVQVDPVHKMVWSAINQDDLKEADADPNETEGIIDDLLTNAPGVEIIFLIKQSPEYTSVSMRSTNNQADVGKFCADNGGGGHVRAAGFKVHGKKPFDEIVSEVISKVRKFQAGRLNIHEENLGETPTEPVVPIHPADEIIKNVGDGHVRPDNETTDQKTTYLDFKKPVKPIVAPAQKQPKTESTPAVPVVGDVHVRPANEIAAKQPATTLAQKPTTEKPSKSKKRRLRRKKAATKSENVIRKPRPASASKQPKMESKPVVPVRPADEVIKNAGVADLRSLKEMFEPQPLNTPAPEPLPAQPENEVIASPIQPTTPADLKSSTPPIVDVKPEQPVTEIADVQPEYSQPETQPDLPDWLRTEPAADKPAPDVEPV